MFEQQRQHHRRSDRFRDKSGDADLVKQRILTMELCATILMTLSRHKAVMHQRKNVISTKSHIQMEAAANKTAFTITPPSLNGSIIRLSFYLCYQYTPPSLERQSTIVINM